MRILLTLTIVFLSATCRRYESPSPRPTVNGDATIYQTCATDPICGLRTHLRIGKFEVEWSNGPDNGGWLYCTDPAKTDNVAVWEFAPAMAGQLKDLSPELVISAEFCSKRKNKAFMVHQGEVLFAHRVDDPDVVYAMEVGKKDDNWRVWMKYRIAEKSKGQNPQWRESTDVPMEDDRNILGSELKLSPEEAQTALFDLLNSQESVSVKTEKPEDPEVLKAAEASHRQFAAALRQMDPVVIRQGIVVVDKRFRFNLQNGSFGYDFGSPSGPFYQSHSGEFRREGNTWRAVLTKSQFFDMPR